MMSALYRRVRIRSVMDLQGQPADVVLVSYTCRLYGAFSEHPA
jgi:hypothetical protein